MASDQFRRKLRQEAELWRSEGLIDPELYQRLADRYQWQTLETLARDRFVMILFGVGSLLLALAAITFVAANWQVWPRPLKVTLLLGLFLGVNLVGFHLWRQSRGKLQRLGHGLLLLGALLLGANLALMAQMFHLSGANYELFLVWGLGVLAMAYSLNLNSLGVCSVILVGIGYLQATPELTSGFAAPELSWQGLLLQHLALWAGLLWLPLAYRCQSRALFALTALLLVYALEVNLAAVDTLTIQGWKVAIAFALPPALLWGYDDLIWPQSTRRLFQPLARTLALVFLSLLFYIFAFHGFWSAPGSSQPSELTALDWTRLGDVLILSGFALFAWGYRWSQARRHRKAFAFDLTTQVIAGMIAISALIPFWHFSISPIQTLATFSFNVLLFLLATGLIRVGLEAGDRRNFWYGMVLLILQIISRMLEYNTALMFKSFVFLLCGMGVVVAGLWFERHLAQLNLESQEHSR